MKKVHKKINKEFLVFKKSVSKTIRKRCDLRKN